MEPKAKNTAPETETEKTTTSIVEPRWKKKKSPIGEFQNHHTSETTFKVKGRIGSAISV